MKIQPIRRLPCKGYPTIVEAQHHPELLENVPARWEKSAGFGALLGWLALSVAARAEPATGPEGMAIPAEKLPEGRAEDTEAGQAMEKAMAVVAPLLEEALEHDGRGSFGCISVCPATFMPEDEALDLIRGELEAAGLKLQSGVELADVPGPVLDTKEVRRPVGAANEIRPRSMRFDWADVERGIYIDYLAKRDYRSWEGRGVSTVDSFDFPEMARKVAAAYAEYPAQSQTWFGVFFDPLADSGVVELELQGLTPGQARMAAAEREKKQEALRGEKGRERLRAQVRHLVEFLREKGVLAPAE